MQYTFTELENELNKKQLEMINISETLNAIDVEIPSSIINTVYQALDETGNGDAAAIARMISNLMARHNLLADLSQVYWHMTQYQSLQIEQLQKQINSEHNQQ